MQQKLYILVDWPEVQELMEKDGFDENAFLRNSLDSIAFPAYFVNKDWYDTVCYQDYLDSTNR